MGVWEVGVLDIVHDVALSVVVWYSSGFEGSYPRPGITISLVTGLRVCHPLLHSVGIVITWSNYPHTLNIGQAEDI